MTAMAGGPIQVELSGDASEAVRRVTRRTGRSEAEVVELAVRRLTAPSILDRLWYRTQLSEHEAMAIAIEEINAERAIGNAS